MSNDLSKMVAPSESAMWMAEYEAMTDDELKALLVKGLQDAGQSILRCACLVHTLTSRGVNMTGLTAPQVIGRLKKVACGQLLPDVMVRFAGVPSLIDRIGCLPLDEQRRLADGGRVLLVVRGEGGQTDHMMADPLKMGREQISQAFGVSSIRDVEQQVLLLAGRREKKAAPVPQRIGHMDIDKELGVARVGRKIITPADLKAALRALDR